MKALPQNRRGQAVSIDTILTIGMTIGVGIMVFAVFAIINAAFYDAGASCGVNTSHVYNSTGNFCYNPSNSSDQSSADSNATQIVSNGTDFLVNLTNQFGTIGTIAGVLLLLGLVVGTLFGGAFLVQKFRSR